MRSGLQVLRQPPLKSERKFSPDCRPTAAR